LLLRVKDTPHQLALPTDRRAGKRCAACVRGSRPRRLAEVRGRSLTLVDDVMTTGATVGELARVPAAGRRRRGSRCGVVAAHAAAPR